jgi:hypothetical protein
MGSTFFSIDRSAVLLLLLLLSSCTLDSVDSFPATLSTARSHGMHLVLTMAMTITITMTTRDLPLERASTGTIYIRERVTFPWTNTRGTMDGIRSNLFLLKPIFPPRMRAFCVQESETISFSWICGEQAITSSQHLTILSMQ